MRKIGDFEIVDHGIQHLNFSGCVSASFEYVVTGFGDNPTEAIHNCLQQMWGRDFNIEDMEARILEQMDWDVLPTSPFVDGNDEKCHDYYHVSIRWNEAHKLPVRIWGLMRCCIATLGLTTKREGILYCQQCNTLMQVRDGYWERVQ